MTSFLDQLPCVIRSAARTTATGLHAKYITIHGEPVVFADFCPSSFRKMVRIAWSTTAAFFASFNVVVGLGTSCSSALGAGNATSGSAYWLQNLPAQGKSAFNGDSSYVVRRNVKGMFEAPSSSGRRKVDEASDYGAKGDGVTDDTAAIK